MAKFWLMKSEPGTYSIDDLARDEKTPWTGVRNYQARNFMKDDMAVGDWVLFYHSSADPTGVAGLGKVASAAYPDPTQFDARGPYYDSDSPKDAPRWWLVDVGFVEKFRAVVPLSALKAEAALAELRVLRRGQRLSVMPVEPTHARKILALAKSTTIVR